MNLRVKPQKIESYYENIKAGKLLQTILNSLKLTEEDAEAFLNSKDLELAEPFTIFGIKEAVEVIEKAILGKQKIAIHGDFDVDGTSATAIMWDYLHYERGVECLPIIPHRVDEGYGLSIKTIEKAIEWGAKLIITVDCGIKDGPIVEAYKDKIDFVITDHHQFSTDENGNIILPNAKAVVHSAHPESKYPTMISGGATSWQLVRALESSFNPTHSITQANMTDKYLDLVALTTVCDIIPLTLENRKLIQRGLRTVAENNRIGLSELLKICSVDPKAINAYHFGFVLGPRLNAPGRVTNDAMDSVRLLSTRNKGQAEALAARLNDLNIQRQNLTSHYMEIAEKDLDFTKKAIVVLGRNWPEGILGLIAGKLAEKHFKPTFIASEGEEGQIIGSSRSPLDSFYLNRALDFAKDHLTRFGGHKQAAGFASTMDKFPGFEEKVIEFITNSTTDVDFEKVVDIDLQLESISDISVKDIEELVQLEPHGAGNPKPIFLFKNCVVKNYLKIGREANHLKLLLQIDGREAEAIGFGLVNQYKDLAVGQTVDVVGHLSVNEWNNNKKTQIEIKYIIVI